MLRMLTLLTILLVAAPVQAADEPLTDAQKKAVGEVVRSYLLENPEVIFEAIEVLKVRQEQAQAEQQQQALMMLRDTVERSEGSPVYGNPDGNVTLVEYFDYNCGYCKKAFPDVMALLEKDKNIRYVLKELPILHETSELAARAALAVWNMEKDKYFAFHSELMNLRGGMTEGRILDIAVGMGLDKEKVKKGMTSPAVDKELAVTEQTAQALGITGTPAFIIGDAIVPGAVGQERLMELIVQARKASDGKG
ncbi:DsbA family protein [Magnetospira sp. QH-2]|uniref:DsbA family protein n=1 Tax=Magnetospira sp. (strain QH-2) TaxID=1288970 RepID=UPI0003E80EA3|nr:DsbA family protein [Magnetospira sp. QH-2]CCQ72396.1 Putative thiol-disulfide oxidoreductase (DSBA oxidoreductase) [Magnetospira sp. QH-2]